MSFILHGHDEPVGIRCGSLWVKSDVVGVKLIRDIIMRVNVNYQLDRVYKQL